MNKLAEKVGEWTLGVAMAIPILIICGVPLMLYHAWALQTCWNWTMPQRFNLPPLDIRGAIAITVTTANAGQARDAQEREGQGVADAHRLPGRADPGGLHRVDGEVDRLRRHKGCGMFWKCSTHPSERHT